MGRTCHRIFIDTDTGSKESGNEVIGRTKSGGTGEDCFFEGKLLELGKVGVCLPDDRLRLNFNQISCCMERPKFRKVLVGQLSLQLALPESLAQSNRPAGGQ